MESLKTLNDRLIEYFGIDTVNGKPIFRIVWANDELEKRQVSFSEGGIELLFPEVKEVRKYPYLKDLYVLERLVIIPDINERELPTSKQSYEPLWAYRDENALPIPPIWTATKFIIDTFYAALGKSSLRKYIDTEENTTPEGMDMRVTKLAEELFGNETETGDALRYGEGVVVPSNYHVDGFKES